jgi:hypothetical protein
MGTTACFTIDQSQAQARTMGPTVTTRRVPSSRPARLALIALGLVVGLAVTGCQDDQVRAQAIADSAATSWEAADAIRRGAPPQQPVEAIQQNQAAIIRATGRIYPPAGVTTAVSAP